MAYLWIITTVLLAGCASNGILLHDFSCKGKATIVGGGSGFSGINGSIDCGDGFVLKSGIDASQIFKNEELMPLKGGITK